MSVVCMCVKETGVGYSDGVTVHVINENVCVNVCARTHGSVMSRHNFSATC